MGKSKQIIRRWHGEHELEYIILFIWHTPNAIRTCRSAASSIQKASIYFVSRRAPLWVLPNDALQILVQFPCFPYTIRNIYLIDTVKTVNMIWAAALGIYSILFDRDYFFTQIYRFFSHITDEVSSDPLFLDKFLKFEEISEVTYSFA